ncbi:MAG: uracil phosphoribosyltransferase [Rhodospirillales bacterium]|nr:MAG: uracil phosphoribosyltransferase [Rhodospirillales bacterium]
MPAPNVTVVDHPLVQHKLSILRDRETSTTNFRRLLREIALLLGYEVTRDLPLTRQRIETPVAAMDAPFIDGKKLVIVPILRAGLGLADGLLDLVPSARVGHIGLYRDPETKAAVEYYFRMPEDAAERLALVCDPMLATANSSIAAVDLLKGAGVRRIKLLCVLAAPEGVAAFGAAHPDVPVTVAAIDERLNDHAYIVPGLGDAGDRMYGTR